MASSSAPPIGVEGPHLLIGVVALPAALYIGSVGFAMTVKDQLPDPLATHWDASGRTNGTMSFGGFVAFVTVLMALLWSIGAAGVMGGRSSRVRFRTERAAMTWCSGTTAFLASLVTATILANLDQTSAATATLPPIVIVASLLAGLFGALIGWSLAGAPPAPPAAIATTTATATTTASAALPELADDEHPVWHGHLTSRLLAILSGVTLVIGLALLPLSLLGAVCILVAVPLLAVMCSIDVVADETGLTVRFGPLGLPRKHIALDRIAGASADDIVPLEWGGWGYRVLPGRSAVVMRSGAAVIVALTDGKQFAVTVDDPAGAAEVLERCRLRARRRGHTTP